MSNLNVKGIKHPSSTETNIALLADGTLGGSAGFNWIINGAFQINQRSGTRTPGVGVYGFDRWKGHANGLEQVIESLPAGEYTLSWTGGGTGTFGGVTSASPVTATVAGGDTSVVVPSDADEVVLVAGSEAGAYQHRPVGTELALCQRYCYAIQPEDQYQTNQLVKLAAQTANGDLRIGRIDFPTRMRVAPTISNLRANTTNFTGENFYARPNAMTYACNSTTASTAQFLRLDDTTKPAIFDAEL